MSLRWTSFRFRLKTRYISKIRGKNIPKMSFSSYPCKNSSKSLLSSVSLIFLCSGARSKPFSRISIFVAVRIFLLKLNTVSDQKYPDNLLSLVTDTQFLEFNEPFRFWILSSTDSNSLSCEVNSLFCEVSKLVSTSETWALEWFNKLEESTFKLGSSKRLMLNINHSYPVPHFPVQYSFLSRFFAQLPIVCNIFVLYLKYPYLCVCYSSRWLLSVSSSLAFFKTSA